MGLFIAIEGGDGSGKATHAKLLADYLRQQNFDVLEMDFPRYGKDSAYYVERYLNGDYGGPNDVPAELGTLSYALDRYAAKGEIIDHLKKDRGVVVSNRFVASNLAHQGTKVSDTATRAAFYERTMKTEYEVLGIPHATKNIVLIMPTEHMQANVDKKAVRSYTTLKRDIHEADSDHLDRAKACFEELCNLYPGEFTAVLCMDQTGKLRSIEDIQQEIQSLVDESARN